MKTVRNLTASLVCLALLSCGTQTNSDPDYFSVWHGFNADEADYFRETVVPGFEEYIEEKTGRDITIDIQFVDFGSMETKLRTAALGKLTPDVAFVDSLKVPVLAYGNALLPIEDVSAFQDKYGTVENAREEFVKAPFDAAMVNVKGVEKQYGFPVQTTTVALYFNRDMFRQKATDLREAGLDPNQPPQDWDELIEYGRVLTDEEAGVYGFGMERSFWFNFPFFNMYQVGWVQFDEQGVATPDIDTENARVALNRLLEIATSGVEGGAWQGGGKLDPSKGFLNRKYAMILTGPWEVKNFAGAGLNFDIGIVPGPSADEVEQLGLTPRVPEDKIAEYGQLAYSSSNLGGQTGVVLRESEDPELAFEFIDYFSGNEVQQKWAEELGQIPVRTATWGDLNTERYPFMPRFMDQLVLAERIPQIPSFGPMETNIFKPEFELLLKQQQSTNEMITAVEQKMENTVLRFYNEALPDS